MESGDSTPSFSRRSSVFTEVGLEGHDPIIDSKVQGRPQLGVRFRSTDSIIEPQTFNPEVQRPIDVGAHVPPIVPTFVRPESFLSRIPFVQLALFIAVVAISYPTFYGQSSDSHLMPVVAKASPMAPQERTLNTLPAKRQSTSTDVCKRWSGQSAIVNGTVYYYGGRKTTSADQTTNQWSKTFPRHLVVLMLTV